MNSCEFRRLDEYTAERSRVWRMVKNTIPSSVVLVDAYSWIFRSYYALPDFRSRSGEPTSAIHGFLSTLPKLADFAGEDSGMRPEMAVFFDLGGPQERLAAYADYKANRPETPEDLKSQIPHIEDALDAMALPRVAIHGVEADDVIASAALALAGRGRRVYVASPDKDFFQILSDRVRIIRTAARMEDLVLFDEGKLMEKFGLTPSAMVDYYALVGDAVDNVPGVRGIGEKTAGKLLAKYPTLDDIYANLDHIPPKTAKLLSAGRDTAYLCRDLVRLRTDIDVAVTPAVLSPGRFDRPRLEKLLTKLDLERLKSRLLGESLL
ncbi:hypothetical protein HY522_06685 [bacterium]|nr:hypothetical protein [bacterium]